MRLIPNCWVWYGGEYHSAGQSVTIDPADAESLNEFGEIVSDGAEETPKRTRAPRSRKTDA